MSNNNLSKLALDCLDTLFVVRILALEEQNEPGIFSKQMQLKDLKSEIINWINTYPKGAFHIKVYDEGDTSILTIMNCIEENVKYEYIIEINEDWTGFIGEQLSETKAHKVVLKIIQL